MSFEDQVRQALVNVLSKQASQVVVDCTRNLEDGEVVMVSYHIEGKWASPASFTFTFENWIPLEESLSAFEDFNARSWDTAHIPPRLNNVNELGI